MNSHCEIWRCTQIGRILKYDGMLKYDSLFEYDNTRTFCSTIHVKTRWISERLGVNTTLILFWMCHCCDCRGAEGKPGNLGYGKVDTIEDSEDDEESDDRVLEEQFNRFTIAMALQDSEMAQQIMQEMG